MLFKTDIELYSCKLKLFDHTMVLVNSVHFRSITY